MNMEINVGYKIRAVRHERKKTLDQVAQAIGISTSALGMYERGMRNPDLKVLLKIANYLDKELEYFYEDSLNEINAINNIITKNSHPKEKIDMAKKRAKGNCELCNKRAPFFQHNGDPYLEIFEIEAEYKEEICNLVMLCPNCNMKMKVLNLNGDLNFLKNLIKSEEN